VVCRVCGLSVLVAAADDDDGATSHHDIETSQSCSSVPESFDCKFPSWASRLRVT